MIVPLAADGGVRVEVAAPLEDRGRALGPLEAPAAASPEVPREPAAHPARLNAGPRSLDKN